MTFSLIHPSRNRPEMAYKAFKNWMDKANHPSDVEYILSIDGDEPKMGMYNELFHGKFITVNKNSNVVQATNNGAASSTGDILIYVSDDFDCPTHWDKLLIDVIGQRDPLQDPFAIEVNDCYQTNRNLLTIPIISRAMYHSEGFFWHPRFASMFCDNWIYERAKRSYKLIDAYHLKFPHLHYSLGHYKMDDTNLRSNQNWNQGKKVFNELCQKYQYNVRY
jgi:hypothetical protein